MTSGRRWLAMASVVLLWATVAAAPSAQAAKPAAQGWWRNSLNLLGVDLTALLDPSTVDVPADGLLVAGGTAVDQPQAIAAVAYQITGAVAGPLRLLPHAATATVPGSGAKACPLDNPTFKATQGGLIADAPKYDCLGAVGATVDATGAYVFDVSTLVRGDVVAVAILPTTTTSRIVFAAPGDDSLKISPATAPASAPPEAGDRAASTAAAATGSAGLPPGSVAGTIATAPEPVTPAVAAADPSPVAAIGSVPIAPSRGSAGRAYALLGLTVAAGAAWAMAGRGRRRAVGTE